MIVHISATTRAASTFLFTMIYKTCLLHRNRPGWSPTCTFWQRYRREYDYWFQSLWWFWSRCHMRSMNTGYDTTTLLSCFSWKVRSMRDAISEPPTRIRDQGAYKYLIRDQGAYKYLVLLGMLWKASGCLPIGRLVPPILPLDTHYSTVHCTTAYMNISLTPDMKKLGQKKRTDFGDAR